MQATGAALIAAETAPMSGVLAFRPGGGPECGSARSSVPAPLLVGDDGEDDSGWG